MNMGPIERGAHIPVAKGGYLPELAGEDAAAQRAITHCAASLAGIVLQNILLGAVDHIVRILNNIQNAVRQQAVCQVALQIGHAQEAHLPRVLQLLHAGDGLLDGGPPPDRPSA